jgi:hypothetical protein
MGNQDRHPKGLSLGAESPRVNGCPEHWEGKKFRSLFWEYHEKLIGRLNWQLQVRNHGPFALPAIG